MNKSQKNEVDAIIVKLTSLVETLQDNFDTKSEKWQESDKGYDAQNEIDNIQSAIDSLNDLDLD